MNAIDILLIVLSGFSSALSLLAVYLVRRWKQKQRMPTPENSADPVMGISKVDVNTLIRK